MDPIIHAFLNLYGLRLEYAYLDGVAGEWIPDERLIRCEISLSMIEQRCTIMHEIGHVVLGHGYSNDPVLSAEQDEAADQWAATRLIAYEVLSVAVGLGKSAELIAKWCWVDMDTLRARLRCPDARHIWVPDLSDMPEPVRGAQRSTVAVAGRYLTDTGSLRVIAS